MATYSSLSHLDCPRCGERHDATVRQGLCPACGSPLLARYALGSVELAPAGLAGRAPDLWRYHELLPVLGPEHVVTLGEGMTPLLSTPRLAESLGLEQVWVKDEGLLPTGTFKARGAAVGVSRAKELGATRMAMPTNGNAGAAWAAYAGRAGLAMTVTMPVDAPSITRVETRRGGWRPAAGRRADLGRRPADRGGRGGQRRTTGSTSRRSRSPTASRARRRWATRSPSSSAGGCPTSSSTRPAAASG